MTAATQSRVPHLPDLDGASADAIIAWALIEFGPDLTVACSMQDTVLVDLAYRQYPDIDVFFLDTGFHFPETYATADRLEARYNIRLTRVRPLNPAAAYDQDGCDACCAARKVLPLTRYLQTKRAWLSGIRRTQTPARAAARAVEWDHRHGLVKINPLITWTDEDVARYIATHDIVVNPLRAQGYESIGCAPCTLPGPGRHGRWAGTAKTECGLHESPVQQGTRILSPASTESALR